MDVYLKNSNVQLFRLTTSLLSSVSCCLLLLYPESNVASVFNILVSLLLFLHPVTLIPVIFVASISSSISILGFSALFYYLFLFILSAVLRKGIRLHVPKKKSILFLAVFLGWLVICSMCSVSGNVYESLKLCFTIVLFVICLSLNICSCKQARKELDRFAVLCMPVILFKLVFLPSAFVIEGLYSTRILSSVSETLNPNQLGISMAVLFVMEFAILCKKRHMRHLIALACLFAILLILKGRTSFFSAILVSGIYLMSECRINKKMKFFIYALIVIVSAVFVVRTISDIDSYEDSAESNEAGKEMSVSSVIQSDGSGRFVTWAFAFSEIIPEHYIHGIGIGVTNYEAIGYERDADNLYVDLLTEIGTPGFILFFLFYFVLMTEIKKHTGIYDRSGRLYVYLMILMLMCGIGETLFDSSFLWMIIFLGFLTLQTRKRKLKII